MSFVLAAVRLHLSRNRQYCQTSNINNTLVGNKNADHSGVVGASPVDAASKILMTKLRDWTKLLGQIGQY